MKLLLRVSVRWMMFAVALMAVVSAGGRPIYFRWQADYHRQQAGYLARRAGGMPICKLAISELRNQPEALYSDIDTAPNLNQAQKAQLKSSIYHSVLALRFDAAASSPWLLRAVDAPAPLP
jgi:hypothetical protein